MSLYYTGYRDHCPGCQCFAQNSKPHNRPATSERARQEILRRLKKAQKSRERAQQILNEPVFSIFGIKIYMDSI